MLIIVSTSSKSRGLRVIRAAPIRIDRDSNAVTNLRQNVAWSGLEAGNGPRDPPRGLIHSNVRSRHIVSGDHYD